MPRCFLVKRSHRPMPISYWTRCFCYPAAGLEGGNPCSSWFLHLFPPLISPARLLPQNPLKPAPVVPQFGTPEGPSSPVPLHSPARAVSEERSLHLASPISAKSFPAPEPLLLGPGGNLKLWAVATAAIASGPLLAPQRSHGPSPGALKRSQGRKAKAARKLHFENKETAKGGGGSGGGNNSSSSEWDTPSPGSIGGGSSGEPEVAGAEEFTCRCCAKHFRCQSTLCKHLPLHHEPLDGLSQARPLPEACLEEAALDGQSPLNLSGECHLCPVCRETFPSKSSQERHLRVLHATQAFPCKYCPVTFYSSPGLTCHINKCHPSENRQVILLQVLVWV
ncbi:insulinoma-associated protein 1 [Crotalus adamanteus]|uniref:Insulinoma-associated protein 1 n=1 Tax=Crotalus adamanteus TaxID=8729 RepID=A0AAW1BAG0_CROAD